MKRKTLAQRNAEIEAANKRFMKMSKPRRRVAIARDVLAQLGTRIIATTGNYFITTDLYDVQVKASDQLQKHLRKVKTCQACAIGSLMFCTVTRANDLTVREAGGVDYGQITSNKNYLSRFFDRKQLSLIEVAFEVSDTFAYGTTDKQNQEAIDFVSEIPEARKFSGGADASEIRLRLIMENIIANKGTFVPSKKPRKQFVTPGYKG